MGAGAMIRHVPVSGVNAAPSGGGDASGADGSPHTISSVPVQMPVSWTALIGPAGRVMVAVGRKAGEQLGRVQHVVAVGPGDVTTPSPRSRFRLTVRPVATIRATTAATATTRHGERAGGRATESGRGSGSAGRLGRHDVSRIVRGRGGGQPL